MIRVVSARLSVVAGIGGMALTSCGTSGGEWSLLQSSDLDSNGAPFHADEILDSRSMQDPGGLMSSDVQAFLQRPPYGAPSFLSDYTSNGLSASDAIVSAAQRYALNPLVFLVRAQMDQGLLGSPDYPWPSTRVEYAFGCGCSAPGVCDAAYGGFDVQVDCLGAALRDSLDQIAVAGSTTGGWGPGATTTTRDGVTVTPQDDSTAALYQYTPVVAQGKVGGNWLFWNLWHKYATDLEYSAPSTAGGGPATWIGEPCTSNAGCLYGGTPGTCAAQYAGGLCTLVCTQSCPSSPDEPPAVCANLGSQGGLCLVACNPVVPQCRSGYTCKSVSLPGSAGTMQSACLPN
jgi:hypothetical protein